MNRRSALKTMLVPSSAAETPSSPRPVNAGLTPYQGPWTFQQASHLLRRTMFGPTKEQIQAVLVQGLEATLDELFQELPLPAPPVNAHYGQDPQVPIGDSWVEAPYPSSNLDGAMSYRNLSLKAWTIGLMLEEGVSVREKLTLFWHNHFPINAILDSKFSYRYITLLRNHAWGNFRELTKAVTIDPAMLRFLDGRRNRKGAPNENYARELLELFTIGKGPQVAPGDYTHYTEEDVYAIARALTGWRDYGFTLSSTDGSIGAVFDPDQHDTGVKALSHRFNQEEIPNLGDQEYAYVVDLIFQQPEVARFISRKLFQWFVYYDVTPGVEADVIEPMAQLLLDHDFEIEPVLRALLQSDCFFDPEYYGVMIKHPYDFLMSTLKPLPTPMSTSLEQKHFSWYRLSGYPPLMQMEYYNLPEVAGWKAYYREPLYYRHWIGATTLPVRKVVSEGLAGSGINPFQANGMTMKVDVLGFLDTLEDPGDPNAVVEAFTRLLLPKPLTPEQYESLKGILLEDLPDFEWAVEYGQYAADPDHSGLAAFIENRLRQLLRAIYSLPEFHLS